MTFAIKVDKSSFAGIHYLTRKLKNPSDLLKEIGEIVVEDIKHRIISSKKDVNDRAFAPWAASTRAARQKDGSAALGILHKSGGLANSIYFKVKNKNTLKVGSSASYAPWLNFGTQNMPERQFMGVSARAREGINESLKTYFGGKK